MSERAGKPPEKLQPGSWTEAEVDAMEGRRVRNAGGNEGTVTAAAGLVHDGAVFQYAVQVQWDGWQQKITFSKGDFENGAFELLP